MARRQIEIGWNGCLHQWDPSTEPVLAASSEKPHLDTATAVEDHTAMQPSKTPCSLEFPQ